MVEIAMVGSAVLYICRIFLNSDSVMTDHAGRFFNPKYSSSYAASQIFLSPGLRFLCCNSVGTSALVSPAADTCFATVLLRK